MPNLEMGSTLTKKIQLFSKVDQVILFVCVEVLRPSQPNQQLVDAIQMSIHNVLLSTSL